MLFFPIKTGIGHTNGANTAQPNNAADANLGGVQRETKTTEFPPITAEIGGSITQIRQTQHVIRLNTQNNSQYTLSEAQPGYWQGMGTELVQVSAQHPYKTRSFSG